MDRDVRPERGALRPARRHFEGLLRAGLVALAAAALLTACGRESGGVRETRFEDSFLAAKVNGRPIYQEDVRAFAVRTGRLRDGEELDPASDIYHLALHDLITERLFAREAESRGLDRDPDVRRALEAERTRILANAIYNEIEERATDAGNVERRYRENVSQLGATPEVQLRHIQFDTREAAAAAKRRLDAGERFESLAYELSRDRTTASEGGELGWLEEASLPDGFRQAADSGRIGEITAPVQSELGWHLIQIENRRQRGAPALASMRPQITDVLRFEETEGLRERLQGQVRIEIAAGRPEGAGGRSGDDEATPSQAPSGPSAGARPPSASADIPMGPGGVAASNRDDPPAQRPTPPPAAPPPETPATPAEERET